MIRYDLKWGEAFPVVHGVETGVPDATVGSINLYYKRQVGIRMLEYRGCDETFLQVSESMVGFIIPPELGGFIFEQ